MVIVVTHASNKITRDMLRALMQQLIKSMLSVRANLAPKNRTRIIINVLTAMGDRLAVTFHLKLSQIARQIAQASIIRQYRMRMNM